ncbi:hypothetical protein [Methanococcus vannielii]|uniref:hypothetical protein n=1 Tax=Methanococcus vannielii TaxID=2187 RepID=UPI00064F13E9|nr:hypothetical protein [Methanococcus vannielii]
MKNFGKNYLKKSVFIPIPASTKFKTKNRYELFSKLVSKRTGVYNGFNLIERTRNSFPKHGGGFGCSEYFALDFKVSSLKNRPVILFDDLYVYGETIDFISRKLKMKEVNHVECLFLGKTIFNDFSNS